MLFGDFFVVHILALKSDVNCGIIIKIVISTMGGIFMIFKVSSDIVSLYNKSSKNINYMLDYFLSVIDPQKCKDYFSTIKEMSFNSEESTVEISETNVKYIKSLFGTVNNELVERLLWVSVLLQEV